MSPFLIRRRAQLKDDISLNEGFRPELPDGLTVYAVGDVHGRLDLLIKLLAKIRQDRRHHPENAAKLIFLGDYIDRGKQSKGVIDYLIGLDQSSDFQITLLKGNHEKLLLDFIGDPRTASAWMDCGGGETLASYGIGFPNRRESADYWNGKRDAFVDAVPPRHLNFLQSLRLFEEIGDYVFVHAGLRRGVPLDRQSERDLLWLRSEASWDDGDSAKAVVHGHTPALEPVLTPSRINIDTGAFATGRLTAIRLQGASRKIIDVRTAIPGGMSEIAESAA